MKISNTEMAVMVVSTYIMMTAVLCLLMTGSQGQIFTNHNVTIAVTDSDMPWNGMTSIPIQSVSEESEESDYPNPLKNPIGCSRDAPAWLCDRDAILGAEVGVIEESLTSLREAKSICPCKNTLCVYSGMPMVIVVLKTDHLNNSQSLTNKKQQVLEMAEKFLNNWKFDTCQDGGITIVSADEDFVVTLIGEASSSRVSTDCQKAVENATLDFFLAGRISEGLKELIEQYRLIILMKHDCNSDHHLRMSVVIPIIVILVGIICCTIIAGVLLYKRQRSKDITEASVPLKEQQRPETA